jgi:hypothetical protein
MRPSVKYAARRSSLVAARWRCVSGDSVHVAYLNGSHSNRASSEEEITLSSAATGESKATHWISTAIKGEIAYIELGFIVYRPKE